MNRLNFRSFSVTLQTFRLLNSELPSAAPALTLRDPSGVLSMKVFVTILFTSPFFTIFFFYTADYPQRL